MAARGELLPTTRQANAVSGIVCRIILIEITIKAKRVPKQLLHTRVTVRDNQYLLRECGVLVIREYATFIGII